MSVVVMCGFGLYDVCDVVFGLRCLLLVVCCCWCVLSFVRCIVFVVCCVLFAVCYFDVLCSGCCVVLFRLFCWFCV